MKKDKLIDAYNFINENFSFLEVDWSFKKITSDNFNYACIVEYKKGNLLVRLNYDYKDNFFYFKFLKDIESITFLDFFQQKEPDLDWKILEPDDLQYKDALMLNVQYFKKYKEDILKMIG